MPEEPEGAERPEAQTRAEEPEGAERPEAQTRAEGPEGAEPPEAQTRAEGPEGAERGLTAELVAVGDELVSGELVDTNSAWLAARLVEGGVAVSRHETVGDHVAQIADAVEAAARRVDVVVVTGGLGPTQDDVTRTAIARVAGVALERRDELVAHVEEFFARSGRVMAPTNLVQADLPAGARVLAPVGTAAGFAVEVFGAEVYCLPGVPAEMRRMVEQEVIPALSRRSGRAMTVSRLVRTSGMSESTVAELAAPVLDRLEGAGQERPNPAVAFLAARGETRVRVTGRGETRHEARALVDPVVEELVARLGAGVAGVDEEGAEHAVARQLHALGWTLAVGESISGGGLGARLVAVAGASGWFRGGIVAYASEVKTRLGDVDAELLAAAGPVSEEVAAAFAVGVCRRLDADCGLAVTGVAGPTTQGDQPVGTVCVGVALPGAPAHSRTVRLPGRDRSQLQEWAASVALDEFRRRLADVGGAEPSSSEG